MSASAPRTVEDYYSVLGVARDATTQDIKKAFRKIARECHPDVAGEKAGARQRFEDARKAYEILVDPVERARYDRRRQPRSNPFAGGFQGFGGFPGFPSGVDATAGFHASSKPGNDIGLEDIFNDFGAFDDFGFGTAEPNAPHPKGPGPKPPPGPGPRSGPMPPPPRSQAERGSSRPKGGTRSRGSPSLAGQDISLGVHVPADIAARGGTVTLQYQRLKRSEDGTRLENYDEIHDLRVPPDTQHGDTLRVPRLGHASMTGLPGELVCDVICDGAAQTKAPRAKAGAGRSRGAAASESLPAGTKADPLPLPVSVSEALLGGRVELATPSGSVRLVVPPCTSSGALLRLRGKNRSDPDAPPTDLYLEVQVVMPGSLDDQSRELILEFARLNSYDPRT